MIERADLALVEMLRNGTIDLAFVTTEMDEPPPELAETTLARDPFALIVGRAHDDLPERMALRAAAGFNRRAEMPISA